MKKMLISLLAIALFCFVTLPSNASVTVPSSGTNTPAVAESPTMNDAVVQDAMLQFKSLSRVEKKTRLAEVKKLAKEYKAQKATASEPSTNTILLVILAILLPPLAVYLHENALNGKFWLSLLLTLLFWLPGVIYALFVVLS
ncbi:MAG: YqaE/Pmp3 family membrane protein [Sediminibacterium sp.]|nr:MAG: hypothetical protein FD183_450 [Chitinophagaceae bacterium]MDP1842996.1 YqaE/Pmp3 family membrane protein [Sediminibacterium sp.]TXT28296.1 MAG: hypothetical protein FD136_2016 [Chitinophagaceae bacterium]